MKKKKSSDIKPPPPPPQCSPPTTFPLSLPPSLSFAQRPRKSKLFLFFFSSISPSFTFKHFCPDSFPEIRGMGTLTVLHSKGGKGQMPKGLGPTDRWRIAGPERSRRRSENRHEALCFRARRVSGQASKTGGSSSGERGRDCIPMFFILPRLSQFDAVSLFDPTACVYPQQSVRRALVCV